MAKRQQMLQQLKRSRKRRENRPEPIQNFGGSKPAETKLLGSIGDCILEFARKNPDLTDKEIAECFDRTIRGSDCSSVTSTKLQQWLLPLRSPEISSAEWTGNLQAFLNDLRLIERGSEDPRSFITYLEVMSS